MDAQIARVRDRHILMLKRTSSTIASIVNYADPADLRIKRDGPEGWTPLDIICHLRDLEGLFIRRAQSVITEHNPTFITYNVNQLVIDHNYAEQDPHEALAAFLDERESLIEVFEGIRDDSYWSRSGVHPAYGPQTLLDVLMHVPHHDLDHIEQMTRVLAQE